MASLTRDEMSELLERNNVFKLVVITSVSNDTYDDFIFLREMADGGCWSAYGKSFKDILPYLITASHQKQANGKLIDFMNHGKSLADKVSAGKIGVVYVCSNPSKVDFGSVVSFGMDRTAFLERREIIKSIC